MPASSEFAGTRVLVMGLGLHGGGAGAAAFFARTGARVTVTDLKSRRELTSSLASLSRFRGIIYHLGGHRIDDFQNTDYVIKNPGVRDDSKFLKAAKNAGASILSDTEVFFRACPAAIIGITGTKGKSTTTLLIGAFLKRLTRGRVWVGGNIRTSMLTFLPKVRPEDRVVLELSSFQLDALRPSRMSPAIAVLTNIFPDHLNRYPSMRAYTASKTGIFRFQKPTDVLFINARDPSVRRLTRRAPGRVRLIDPKRVLGAFANVIPASMPPYHLPNIALAVAVAKHCGAEDAVIRAVLRRFKGVSGRMEHVRTVKGVRYINDTTATNPTAALSALRVVKREVGKGRIFVIAGGSDKGLPVRDFCRVLARDADVVIFLPGKASEQIKLKVKSEKSKIRIYGARTMQDAVTIARRNALPGDTVLLSPGAASFGLFRHEFDRGDQFARAVERLPR